MIKRASCPDCHSKRKKKAGLDWVKVDKGRVKVQRLVCLDCGRNYREFVKDNG